MSWDKVLPAITGLAGVAVGAFTLLLTGWVEAEKQAQIKKADALVHFAEVAWGSGSDQHQTDLIRKISGLTVFADQPVLDAYTTYIAMGCGETGDATYQCRSAWADVANSMRTASGVDKLNNDVIIKVLWGDLGTK